MVAPKRVREGGPTLSANFTRVRSFVNGATSSGVASLPRRLARVPSTPPTTSVQTLPRFR